MSEISYKPEDVGRKIMNDRGKGSIIRKYHMTEIEKERIKKRWEEEIKDKPKYLKKLAGKYFFNPYRKGIYHYQISALYLLGCNKWHNLSTVKQEMEKNMSEKEEIKDGTMTNAWELFRGKSCRENALKCKDYTGRIQENMIFFQRLGKLHPCGYKLKQVFAALDIKKITTFFNIHSTFYRLSTYEDFSSAFPIRDYKKYIFPTKESKFVNYKFIGKIITKDKVIVNGKVEDEMS